MDKLPIIGILILMLLVISGYVSSSPSEDTQLIIAESTGRHLDPHVTYYEDHLITMGIERRKP